VVISQSDIWWADLGVPTGLSPGYRRPVVIVQCDAINQSRIATVVCVPLTGNTKWATAPGNVALKPSLTGLDKLSVANTTWIVAIDKTQLLERVGSLPKVQMAQIFAAIDVTLGR
jgi:mRNA interferase MazF